MVESGAVGDRLEVVTPEKIGADIASAGHVILDGILFDYDSARLHSDSAPALAAIVAWLKASPEARVFVAGHTDGKGRYD